MASLLSVTLSGVAGPFIWIADVRKLLTLLISSRRHYFYPERAPGVPPDGGAGEGDGEEDRVPKNPRKSLLIKHKSSALKYSRARLRVNSHPFSRGCKQRAAVEGW